MYATSYHDTQPMLSSDQVAGYQVKAGKQDDVVLAVFRSMPGRELSPEDVHQLCLRDAPLTSVRRAITNLTVRGLLVKTDHCRPGLYGRPVGLWTLADKQLRLF